MRNKWTFATYIEEIVMLSEIQEIPGIKQKIAELIKEAWIKFPKECEDLGLRLRDGVQN